MASIHKLFNGVLVQTEKQYLDAYTQKLRDNLKQKYGWPSHIADNIRIAHDGNTPDIRYPEALDGAVRDIENGTPDSRPNPGLRMFMLGDR